LTAIVARIMPRWICESEGIVEHITIPIERLRIGRPRHKGIRAEEATQLGVIPAGIVVTQTLATRQAAFVVLAGEALGGQIAESPAAVAAVGVVIVVGQRGAGLIHKATTRLQVVLQQVEDPVIDTIAATAQGIAVIVGGHLVGGAIFNELKHAGNVDGRHPTDRTLDPIPVSVIDKAGRRPAADYCAGQSIS
jgi:hypothetical protein